VLNISNRACREVVRSGSTALIDAPRESYRLDRRLVSLGTVAESKTRVWLKLETSDVCQPGRSARPRLSVLGRADLQVSKLHFKLSLIGAIR
jgi:hypothetical protein